MRINPKKMKVEDSDRKPFVAAIIATIIMLFFSVAFHMLVVRVGWSTSRIKIASDMLDGFPINIGNWKGLDIPLEDEIARKTGTDAHLNRRYTHNDASKIISLYIGCGGWTSEIVYHQPNVCYIGSGWTIEEQHSLDLPFSDDKKLPCTIYQFVRNELNKQRATVLHYWILDGEFCRDASLLRSRVWRITSKVNYIAQVQIICPVRTSTADSAEKVVSEFAIDTTSLIAELFEHIKLDQDPQSMASLEE